MWGQVHWRFSLTRCASRLSHVLNPLLHPTMESIKFEEPARKYHPLFASQDADIVLSSTEGSLYRIPSYVLRNTSGFFRRVLSLPQPSNQDGVQLIGESIATDERDCVVERVLRLICGLETPKWGSFDELEDAVTLASKWDAPGPLSIIRSGSTAPSFLAEPLRLYLLATRFGWEEEAKLASTYTLTLSLYDEVHADQLKQLAAKDLMALLSFHRRRRDEFKSFVDSDELFNAGNASRSYCTGCGEEVENHSWREFKSKMFSEMDRRPLGDTLIGLDMEEWPESVACWNAKCQKEGCGRLNYNKLITLRDIKDCIDRLPATI